MQINKKLLASLITVFSLFVIVSCSPHYINFEPLKDDTSKKQQQDKKQELTKLNESDNRITSSNTKWKIPQRKTAGELLNLILPHYQKFTTIKTFIPDEWLKPNNGYVKYKRVQKNSDGSAVPFNELFFSDDLPTIDGHFIKISNISEFNEIIINRFKELHNFDDFNQDSQITKLFEELYLNKQDLNEVLKTSDIFITKYNEYRTHGWSGIYIIPFYENNKVTLNIIDSLQHDYPAWILDSHAWEVFIIPKNVELVLKKYFQRDVGGKAEENFGVMLNDWYSNDFIKHYPEAQKISKK